jgi:hypothetical protein
VGDAFGVEVLDGLTDADEDLADVVEGEEGAQVFLEVLFEVALFAELEDEVVVVGGFEGLVESDDVGVVDALDDQHLLADHLALLLAHRPYFDHLDGVALQLALLAALEHLAGCA